MLRRLEGAEAAEARSNERQRRQSLQRFGRILDGTSNTLLFVEYRSLGYQLLRLLAAPPR